MQERDTSYGII